MIQRGTYRFKVGPPELKRPFRLMADNGPGKIRGGAVATGRNKIDSYLGDREPVQQNTEALMFDMARKRPATHHPGFDIKPAVARRPAYHGDQSQRAEPVFVFNCRDKGVFRRCEPVPVAFRVALAI